MPLFQYEAYNKRGALVAGTLDAASLQMVKDMLQGQGLMPTKIVESSALGSRSLWARLNEKKVDLKTVILFTKQLSVLLKSAVPLLQALELLIEQFEDPFRRIVISIKDGVKSGEPLAKELAKHPKIFTNVYVQLVRAGEASGKLDVILFRLTDYLLRSEETKKKVKKAMTTPLMTLGFSLVVVAGLLVGLVPKLSGLFTKMGENLPMPTVILMALSNFMIHHFTSFIVGIVVAIVAFISWKSTPQGKLFLDELFLKLPLTAYFTKTKAVVQFSQTLGMLLESGVNLSQALDIVCNIVENKVLVEKLGLARDKIIKEGKIARYLKETGMFPNIASYMISTGEQSGKLADMLLTVGHDYEEELNDLSDGLTAKINPIMTMILGVIVLFIIAAIFLPIMGMGDMAGI